MNRVLRPASLGEMTEPSIGTKYWRVEPGQVTFLGKVYPFTAPPSEWTQVCVRLSPSLRKRGVYRYRQAPVAVRELRNMKRATSFSFWYRQEPTEPAEYFDDIEVVEERAQETRILGRISSGWEGN